MLVFQPISNANLNWKHFCKPSYQTTPDRYGSGCLMKCAIMLSTPHTYSITGFESLNYSAYFKVQKKKKKKYLNCTEKMKLLDSMYCKTSFMSVILV